MEELTRMVKPKLPGKPRWVRLTDQEFLVLHNYAVMRGMSFAAYARRVLLREVARLSRATTEEGK